MSTKCQYLLRLYVLIITVACFDSLNLDFHRNNPFVGKPRIIGGQSAKLEQWPFIAVIVKGPIAVCGGSIIRRNWVLTAAHCLDSKIGSSFLNKKPLGITVGEVELVMNNTMNIFHEEGVGSANLPTVKDIILAETSFAHPKYRTIVSPGVEIAVNDIGLIKLTRSVDKYRGITFNKNPVVTGATCESAGWGMESINPILGGSSESGYRKKNVLFEVKLQLADNIDCAQTIHNVASPNTPFNPKSLVSNVNDIIKDKVCAISKTGDEAINKGDSGGPLVCDGKLWGVANMIVATESDKKLFFISIFTKVSSHVEWIDSIIKQPKPKEPKPKEPNKPNKSDTPGHYEYMPNYSGIAMSHIDNSEEEEVRGASQNFSKAIKLKTTNLQSLFVIFLMYVHR